MYAVIRTGGKQYRVRRDDVIAIERVPGDVGMKCRFDEVVLLGKDGDIALGAPFVPGALVHGEIIAETRAPKITIYKKRQRSTYRRKIGHRQQLNMVRIVDIVQAQPPKPPAPPKPAAPAADIPGDQKDT